MKTTYLGKTVEFKNEGRGVINKETNTHVHIESNVFDGWMSKEEFEREFKLVGDSPEVEA